MSQTPIKHLTHKPDADGICTRCGFDSHEWRWWRYNTAEGMTRKTPPPVCDSEGNRALRRMRSAGVKGEKSE